MTPTTALEAAPVLISLLDFTGVAVFAATGALAAAREKHDPVTFAFFGAMTGVGGGTLRDLLLGLPIFWVQDWRYMAVCLVAAIAVWIIGAGEWRFRALLWLDALGLSAYGVLGAAKAEAAGASPLICIVMGALTACFGGIVRDILAGQPSILLRREITISAAILAATVFVAMRAVGLEPWPAALIAAVCGFGLRAGALIWGWSLPAFPGGLGGRRSSRG